MWNVTLSLTILYDWFGDYSRVAVARAHTRTPSLYIMD